MKTIGLICEGVSEINVMDRIISKYLADNVIVHPIEPETKMENGFRVQSGYGGWKQVLEHCNDETVERILEYNDYLVIQIDTDASIEKGYDVPPFDSIGRRKPDAVFYDEVKTRVLKSISAETQEKYTGRIILAICIDEIECWLLPLFYTNCTRSRTHNCIYTLNQALSKKDIGRIPPKEKNGPLARIVYSKILKNLRNKQTIRDCAQFHYGFNELIKQLDLI